METVGELIAKLQEFDPSAPVRVCDTFPYHHRISAVEIPKTTISAPCVTIYSDHAE